MLSLQTPVQHGLQRVSRVHFCAGCDLHPLLTGSLLHRHHLLLLLWHCHHGLGRRRLTSLLNWGWPPSYTLYTLLLISVTSCIHGLVFHLIPLQLESLEMLELLRRPRHLGKGRVGLAGPRGPVHATARTTGRTTRRDHCHPGCPR